jgi:hypothetical protein
MSQPTPIDLALIAAKLDPKLSPDEAVTRARAIWEAADRNLRADEIAAAQEDEQVRADLERLERLGLGLRCDRISLPDGFRIACEIAQKHKVAAYKIPDRFAEAMRAAKLTRTRPIYGKTVEEWVKSNEAEMSIIGTEEYTSEKAVEELYRMKAESRRKKDRARKAAKKVKERARKKLRKSSAERSGGKTERQKESGAGRSTIEAEQRGKKRNYKSTLNHGRKK